MDQQWTAYSESNATRQARYDPHTMTTPQQVQRDPALPQQIKQEQFASPPGPSRTNSMATLPSPGSSLTLSRSAEYNDRDGDVAMEDADPYKPKYAAARPNHQHRHSQSFLQQEESAAARRYSPMNMSPTSPYSGNPQQGGQNYTSFTPQAPNSNRQSPTRGNPYISTPNSYYSPPGTSIFGSTCMP
jgi:dual specificity protein kinase YAK1